MKIHSEFSSLQSVLSVNFASLTYFFCSIGGCAKTCLIHMYLFCTFHTKLGQLSVQDGGLCEALQCLTYYVVCFQVA